MTFNRVVRTFFSGLAVVLPIVVTLALMAWMLRTAESLLGGTVRFLLPDGAYLGGMGLLTALVLIFLTGLLMEAILFRRLVTWLEGLLDRIPLVKTIYGAVRDMMSLFSKGDGKKFSKVVLVDVPGMGAQVLGFITIDDHTELPFKAPGKTVAVYFPMSYQIGGYTLFLPRERVKPTDMPMEEAMRFIVTAGMSRSA